VNSKKSIELMLESDDKEEASDVDEKNLKTVKGLSIHAKVFFLILMIFFEGESLLISWQSTYNLSVVLLGM